MSSIKSNKIVISKLALIIFTLMVCKGTLSAGQDHQTEEAKVSVGTLARPVSEMNVVFPKCFQQNNVTLSPNFEQKKNAMFFVQPVESTNILFQDCMINIHLIKAMRLKIKSLDANSLKPIEFRILQMHDKIFSVV